MLNRILLGLFCVALFALTSCTQYKKFYYFKNIPDSLYQNPYSQPATSSFSDPMVKPDDILQVSIQPLDPQVTSVLTPALVAGGSGSTAAAGSVTGYLVDKDGYINLQLVGHIQVAGKTTSQIRDLLTTRSAVYFKDPVVNVRFANFKITVLGEVGRPGQIIIPDERVSILDAIAMAGDLNSFAKRTNILLIRKSGNENKYIRFNINSSEILQSPYFYLQQGDIIYVEPTKSKIAAADLLKQQNISYVLSFITISLLILTFVKR